MVATPLQNSCTAFARVVADTQVHNCSNIAQFQAFTNLMRADALG